MFGPSRLAVVIHPSDGGLAEEAVLVVHQVLVDAGPGYTRDTSAIKTELEPHPADRKAYEVSLIKRASRVFHHRTNAYSLKV